MGDNGAQAPPPHLGASIDPGGQAWASAVAATATPMDTAVMSAVPAELPGGASAAEADGTRGSSVDNMDMEVDAPAQSATGPTENHLPRAPVLPPGEDPGASPAPQQEVQDVVHRDVPGAVAAGGSATLDRKKPQNLAPKAKNTAKARRKKNAVMTDFVPINDKKLCNVCMDSKNFDFNSFVFCGRWVLS